MLQNQNLSINENGNLIFGGCDTVKLCEQYGTPLYVMDEQILRNNCRLFKKSININYDNGLVVYAGKALNCLEVVRIIKDEGLGLDVASGGELYTALKANFPVDKIFFHGNNKSTSELTMAVENKVGVIVVDNIYELEELNEIAQKHNTVVNIYFRIKPGIDAHVHDLVRVGHIDSKFGFALENGEAFKAVEHTKGLKGINLKGIHCHIGSQIFSDEPYKEAAKVMLDFYLKISNDLGINLEDLNLGGGFGIKYLESDSPLEYDKFMVDVSKIVKDICKENGINVPRIIIEPGRSIVGTAGITLYTVGAVKEIKGIRNYVTVDGGMGDNPRYSLYRAPYSVIIANKAAKPKDYTATIAGKSCESDLLQENVKIAKPDKNDILAFLSTGAYNYSMSSNYNRIPRPSMVMVSEGKSKVIIKRESYADLVKNDL